MKQNDVQANLFYSLGEEDLREIKQYAREKSFSKGQTIWFEGDAPGTVWLVKEGRVHITKATGDNGCAIMDFFTAGQAICTAALIMGKAFACNAVAATDSVLLAIPAGRFQEFLSRLPQFARNLLKEMAPSFCEAHCNQALAAAPVKTRLAALLARLNKQFEGASLPFTRQELSQMAGTTVETTIRTLSECGKQGFIHSTLGKIRVLKLGKLEEIIKAIRGE
jgi:CRP-like cAMP-binding protein